MKPKSKQSGWFPIVSARYAVDPRRLMPKSHVQGSPRRFYYGLNLTDDPGNANFRSPIRMHYIRMIKYYYVWLRMQYGKLRTSTNCHEWCRIGSVANPAFNPWMCDLGITCVSFLTDLYSECVNVDLRCLRNKANRPEVKPIRFSYTFSQRCT